MLAYAASRPIVADRPSSPSTLLVVIGLHAAVLAVVMSAKMDLPERILNPPIGVELNPDAQAPSPDTPANNPTRPQPDDSQIDHTTSIVPIKLRRVRWPSTKPRWIRARSSDLRPLRSPIRRARSSLPAAKPGSSPRPGTSSRPIRPRRSPAKRRRVLRLRITIDERGRVIAVEPLGRVDPAFLESARRHLLSHWRYKPAIEGGRPVTSSTVIRLRFQLDG